MSFDAGYSRASRSSLTDIFGMNAGGTSVVSTPAAATAAISSLANVQTRGAGELKSVVSFEGGAGANIQPNMQSAAAVEVQVEADMMAFKQTIKSAQNEIMAAAKATGNGGMFADTRMGNGGEGGVLFDAVMGGATGFQGAGSFALNNTMSALNNASLVDTVASEIGSQKMSREDAENAIKDRLIQMSSARNAEMAMKSTNFFGPQQAAPDNAAFDWASYFNKGGTVKALMSVDANDPDTFAQYKDLTAIYGDVETTTAELTRAQTETLDHNRDNVLDGINEESVAVQSWSPNDRLLLGIHSASEILEGISGARVSDAAVSKLEARNMIAEIAPTIRPQTPSFPVAAMGA